MDPDRSDWPSSVSNVDPTLVETVKLPTVPPVRSIREEPAFSEKVADVSFAPARLK